MKEINQNHEQSFRALLDDNGRSNICAISISGRRKYGADKKMRALSSVLSTEKNKRLKTAFEELFCENLLGLKKL
jgi:hypothetical protein